MSTQTVADTRAWRAGTIDPPKGWYYPLSEHALSALDQAVDDWRAAAQPVTELRASEALRATVAPELEGARAALEAGRGFAVIPAGRSCRRASGDLHAVYWLVGQLLGRPFEQNVQGTLLYD